MEKIKHKLWKPYIILPIVTLFCLAGFIGSYLFPNTVLDTYVINMEEEGEDTQLELPLSLRSPIVYEMDTGGLAMRGIQVGICKRGYALTDTVLSYNVYVGDTCVSKNSYAVADGDDLQYVYLPYENYEQCIGHLRIEFLLESAEADPQAYPTLTANHRQVKDTVTTVPVQIEQKEPVSLKCSYIYTHKTYPFLYDFRLLTFVFLAASMTVSYPRRARKEGTEHAA